MRRFLAVLTAPFRILFSAPAAVLSAPRRLLGMSLPVRVAVLLGVFLAILVLVFVGLSILRPNSAEAGNWMRYALFLLLLIIFIPFLVYKTLSLWLQGPVARFPDIDFAWNEGLSALAKNRIDLSNVPVFLVLGARDDAEAAAVMGGARLGFRVSDAPPGQNALHWYGNNDAVYLVCTECGRLSLLSREGMGTGEVVVDNAAEWFNRTLGPDDLGGTLQTADPHGTPREPIGSVDASAGTIRDSLADGGTLMEPLGGGTLTPGELASPGPNQRLHIDAGRLAAEDERLAYVCELLGMARPTLCPINGVLTLLPFDVIQQSDEAGSEVANAVRGDVRTIRRVTQLRCTAAAMVIGMEKEPGFSELVRRVTPEKAAETRFGKGGKLWCYPLPDQVEAVVANACGSFERQIYGLFRDKQALEEPGNRDLYTLLIKIRQNLRERLANILVAAFGHDPERTEEPEEPLLFSGVYFGATGERTENQAFLHSVFKKLQNEQGELAWNRTRIEEDKRYYRWARLAMIVNGILVAVIAGMFAVKLFVLQ